MGPDRGRIGPDRAGYGPDMNRKVTFPKKDLLQMELLYISIHPDPPNLVLYSNSITIVGNGWKNPKSKKGCVKFSRQYTDNNIENTHTVTHTVIVGSKFSSWALPYMAAGRQGGASPTGYVVHVQTPE